MSFQTSDNNGAVRYVRLSESMYDNTGFVHALIIDLTKTCMMPGMTEAGTLSVEYIEKGKCKLCGNMVLWTEDKKVIYPGARSMVLVFDDVESIVLFRLVL